MTIREHDKAIVCRHCKRTDLDGLTHGQWVPDGPEEGHQVCVWPCGHEAYPDEFRCFTCKPYNRDEEAPF